MVVLALSVFCRKWIWPVAASLTNRGECGRKIDVVVHREKLVGPAGRRPDLGFNCGFPRLRARAQVRIGPDMHEARDLAGRGIHRGENGRELLAHWRLLLPGRERRRQAGWLQQISAHLEDWPVAAGLEWCQEWELVKGIGRALLGELKTAVWIGVARDVVAV